MAEYLYGMSPYQSMGNNPILYNDPDGDLFFVIPQISFSGGLSVGLEAGIGIPGVLSASVSGGIGTHGGYASIQGTAGGFTLGYGTGGGFASFGYAYGGISGGLSYSSGGLSASAGYGGDIGNGLSLYTGLNYGGDGLSFSSSLAYTGMPPEPETNPNSEIRPGGVQSISPEKLPDGRYIWELSDEELELFANWRTRSMVTGCECDIDLAFSERLWLIGKQFTFALPSTRIIGFGATMFSSKTFGYQSKLFGRSHPSLPNGQRGILNTGEIRTGWGWNGTNQVFRTGIGTGNHIDWFLGPRM